MKFLTKEEKAKKQMMIQVNGRKFRKFALDERQKLTKEFKPGKYRITYYIKGEKMVDIIEASSKDMAKKKFRQGMSNNILSFKIERIKVEK